MQSGQSVRVAAFADRLAKRHDLSADDRALLAALPARLHVLEQGVDLTRIDERGRFVHLVLSGMLARFVQSSSGARQSTEIYLVDDMADFDLIPSRQRQFSFQTLAHSTLLSIDRDALAKSVMENAQILRAMWSESAAQNERMADRLAANGLRDAQGRLARFLCEAAVRAEEAGLGTRSSFSFPMTQAHIAEVLALTPVHVNRSMRRLNAAGLIQYGAHKMTIDDWDALARLGEWRFGSPGGGGGLGTVSTLGA